jgi:hypothetical protein
MWRNQRPFFQEVSEYRNYRRNNQRSDDQPVPDPSHWAIAYLLVSKAK